jgi:hypothetical protein
MKYHRLPTTIKRRVNGKTVRQRISDGYINLDDLLRAIDAPPEKTLDAFLASPEGQATMQRIAKETGIPIERLIDRGPGDGPPE